MAALIDDTYFIREINIPQNALDSDMSVFIAQYEKEVLILLLGYDLYVDFIANPSDTRWSRLISGHEYDVSYQGLTTTIKWNGLTNTDLISLLAYYIYYWYLNFHATDTTSVGESVIEKENALGVTPVQKMTSAWNNFVDLYGRVGEVIIKPSAYNFLTEFKDDATNGYDGWIFTPMESGIHSGKMNVLGV